MSGAWLQALAPLLVLAAGTTVLLLLVAQRRDAGRARRVATGVLLGAAAAALLALSGGPPVAAVTPLLVADAPALLLAALFCLGGAATAVLAGSYLAGHAEQQEEFYLLLLLATLGAAVLAYAVHAGSLLLGLELLAVASYGLVAYPAERRPPVEAAVKYLVLSGAATATLLFGFALLFAAGGALGFRELGAALGAPALAPAVPVAGATLVLVGFAFKLAAAPFHFWVAEVYEGAPAPVSGFLASVAKAAMLFALLRLFIEADLFRFPAVVQGTAVLAVLSMFVGNWLALRQNKVKRLLAYSSVAHAGYLLIIFSAGAAPALRPLAAEAGLFYLLAYVPTTLAAFALLSPLAAGRGGEELLATGDLAGLFWRQPLLAGLFFVALLSLAGIPLTAGFIAKFYLFAGAVAGGHWLLLGALVAGSALGIYYYLRLVYQMTLAAPEAPVPAPATGRAVVAVAWTLGAAILLLGVLPGALLGFLDGLLV